MTRPSGGGGPAWCLATACGLGRIPVAPGTAASAAAAALWYLAAPSAPAQGGICLVTIAAGFWASSRHAEAVHDSDPSEVVIDEVAGMWLTLWAAPRTIPVVLAGFVLFRLLDIGKFPPMRQLERLPGGLGIMMDDIAAGVIGRILLGIGLGLSL